MQGMAHSTLKPQLAQPSSGDAGRTSDGIHPSQLAFAHLPVFWTALNSAQLLSNEAWPELVPLFPLYSQGKP